jgi:hypothetical protein
MVKHLTMVAALMAGLGVAACDNSEQNAQTPAERTTTTTTPSQGTNAPPPAARPTAPAPESNNAPGSGSR